MIDTLFTIGWILWIVWFAVLETLALQRKRFGDTLSEHVWRWFFVLDDRSTWRTWLGRALLIVGGVWLTGHLAFGWWTL